MSPHNSLPQNAAASIPSAAEAIATSRTGRSASDAPAQSAEQRPENSSAVPRIPVSPALPPSLPPSRPGLLGSRTRGAQPAVSRPVLGAPVLDRPLPRGPGWEQPRVVLVGPDSGNEARGSEVESGDWGLASEALWARLGTGLRGAVAVPTDLTDMVMRAVREHPLYRTSAAPGARLSRGVRAVVAALWDARVALTALALVIAGGLWAARTVVNMAPQRVAVSLRLPNATDVRMVGDFNDWNVLTGTRAERVGESDRWFAEVRLRPGLHRLRVYIGTPGARGAGWWGAASAVDAGGMFRNAIVVFVPRGSGEPLVVVPEDIRP